VSKPCNDNPKIKPLMAIPIIAIKDVQRVNFTDLLHDPVKADKKTQNLLKHQFEIFL